MILDGLTEIRMLMVGAMLLDMLRRSAQWIQGCGALLHAEVLPEEALAEEVGNDFNLSSNRSLEQD
jgi:hypothetical protein